MREYITSLTMSACVLFLPVASISNATRQYEVAHRCTELPHHVLQVRNVFAVIVLLIRLFIYIFIDLSTEMFYFYSFISFLFLFFVSTLFVRRD